MFSGQLGEMKFGIATLLIIILLTTCKKMPDKVNGQVGQQFSVTDSLLKYSQADSLTLPYEEEGWTWDDPETGDSSKFIKKGIFFVGQLNDVHFAFTIASSDINFYQLIDGSWQKEKSPYLHLSSSNYKLKYVDIDGNGLRDIVVDSRMSKESNDWDNEVFLFDRKLNRFDFRPWTAENLEYDTQTGLIRSRQEFCNCKLLFKIEGEDLILQKMVRYFEDKGQARIEYSHPKESIDIIDSKIVGKPDSVWTIFSTALWDTSNEWKRKE
jgi:hypothetical protein